MGMKLVREGAAAVASALLVFGILAGAPVPAKAAEAVGMSTHEESNRSAIKYSMRILWAEHVIWTRAYIVAAMSRSPDAPDVSSRLLRNQADIGEAFAPYYGKEAGAKLAELLKQHILLAAEVVKAVDPGDDKKFRAADKRWHENADDIAVFLSGINPNWSKKEILDMFNDHLALTTKEAVSRFEKKWPDDISAFDEIFRQMMMMADDLSDGIIKQFPKKFKEAS